MKNTGIWLHDFKSKYYLGADKKWSIKLSFEDGCRNTVQHTLHGYGHHADGLDVNRSLSHLVFLSKEMYHTGDLRGNTRQASPLLF